MTLCLRIATALVSATFLSCTVSGRRHESSGSLSAELIRAEIDGYVCAVWSEEAEQWSAEFLSGTCGSVAATTEPSATIKRAVSRAAQIVPLGNTAYDQFYATVGQRSRHEQKLADKLARRAFWSDPVLSRAAWLSVCLALRDSALASKDCSSISEPHTIEVSWDAFFPYLRAYVWPMPGPTGSGVEIFVCSEINGTDDLPETGELVQAGFLAAAGVAEDRKLSGKIADIVDMSVGSPADLSAVKRDIETLLDTPSGRRSACSALRRSEWFTGVSVRDCR